MQGTLRRPSRLRRPFAPSAGAIATRRPPGRRRGWRRYPGRGCRRRRPPAARPTRGPMRRTRPRNGPWRAPRRRGRDRRRRRTSVGRSCRRRWRRSTVRTARDRPPSAPGRPPGRPRRPWRRTRRRRTRRRCSWCGSDSRRSRKRLPCRRIGWRRECRGLGDRQPAAPHGCGARWWFVGGRVTTGLGAPHEARADREPGCVRGHPCRPQW